MPGQRYCKACHAAYMREWRKDHPLTGQARLRHNARKYAHTYKSRGHITPKPCEVCGTKQGLEMHHDDYRKPLLVRWFCREHHLAHHDGWDKRHEPRTRLGTAAS